MKINRIVVNNIGSYEGENIFNIAEQNEDGKIVLIGGKNGAGKTTLFNAIKLCLYGYKDGGYQSINTFYKKRVKKLINNNAKRIEGCHASVEMEFVIAHSTECDTYKLSREWVLNGKDIDENVNIWKNDKELTEDEKNDFDNYILNIIPPELFELYFFDGEKITEFFLQEGSNARIKNAFLILCGYDTFEIMYRNFKRVNLANKADDEIINRYTIAKERYVESKKIVDKIALDIADKKNELDSVKSLMTSIEKNYRKAGGVTVNEWNEKFLKIKEQEHIREIKNEWIKKAANDIIPFLIMKDKIAILKSQIEDEENTQNAKSLVNMCYDTMDNALKNLYKAGKIDNDIVNEIKDEMSKLLKNYSADKEVILGLSIEEKAKLNVMLAHILALDENEIIENRKEVRKSIEMSKNLRAEIENSSINKVQEYLEEKEKLLLEIEKISQELDRLYDYQKEMEIDKGVLLDRYKREEKLLEDELKKNSITDLSSRAIVFLEELQNKLFTSEIRKVETNFMNKIIQMARKSRFIDKIIIDDNFGIHIFREDVIQKKELVEKFLYMNEETYIKEYGEYHWNFLLEEYKCNSAVDLLKKVRNNKNIKVLYEIDKSVLSKGEQQIFIMTLYWAIMKLCKQEVPFFIDTPFARIDSEHRENITKNFFRELNGQVFIFSTNEEIVGKHVELLEDCVQAKFILENVDNLKTNLIERKYFGEEYGI